MSIVLNNVSITANVATIAALPTNTYSNGLNNDGIGATLTATSNIVFPTTIDGWTPVQGGIVLVMNEATAANNGLYVISSLGIASSKPWVFTRVINMQTSDQFNGCVIPVGNNGTVNKNSMWMFNYVSSFSVGTSPVAFSSLGVLGMNKNVQVLPYASGIVTWDISLGLNATVTLTANSTLSFTSASLPTGNIGIYGTLVITQDATGSRTLALPAGHLVVGGGAGVLLLSTAANAIDIVTFYYDASTSKFYWTYAPNFTHA